MSDYQEYIVRDYINLTEYRNKEGSLHRLNGPAVQFVSGTNRWYQNGKLHRLDGPAIEYANGTKEWWKNGELHRLDGPAVDYGLYKEWWINGTQYNKKEFKATVKNTNKDITLFHIMGISLKLVKD